MTSINYFQLPDPSVRIMAQGFTQPLTELNTSSRKVFILMSRTRPMRKPDSLTAICEPIVKTVGSSTSHNPVGLRGLLPG
jgi:hypothetical protein